MASEYSRVIAFSGYSNAIKSIELPAPSYGVLDRVIITQTSPASNTGSGTFKVYDRRSACIGLTDLNVTNSGSIVSITNTTTNYIGEYDNGADYSPGDVVSYEGSLWVRVTGPNPGYPPGDNNWTQATAGKLTVVFNAAHNLIAGVSFLIKDCATAAYNTIYTVTTVVSTTSVTVSSLIGAATATTGLWQTLPFNPRNSPPTSLVYSGSVVASTTYEGFNLNRSYENKDNQDIHLRTRHTGLWLEFTADSLGSEILLGWEVAYTCQTNPSE